jgi:glycosyltransferase involved in cell wall biosynthesis
MRIGFYSSNAPPDIGGAHTFEKEVENCLFSGKQLLLNEYVKLTDYLPSNLLSERTSTRLDQLERGIRCAVWNVYPRLETHTSWRWRKALENSRVDAIWSCCPSVPTRELPYAIHVWDIQHRRQPFFPEVSMSGGWLERERRLATLIQRACLVFTGTEVGGEELRQYYGVEPSRIKFIPHPTPAISGLVSDVELEKASREFRKRWGSYLFYPAQFWPHKNHVCLVDMIDELKRRGRRYQLVLSGSDQGNAEYVLEYARRAGLAKQVTLLGFLERSTLPALYSGAHALVYATLFGPENLPPLEAFEMQCPVIAGLVAGAESQLGDAAILVNPTMASEYADAVMRLEDPETRAKYISRGTERALRYKPEDLVRDVDAAFADVVPYRRTWRYASSPPEH